MNKTTDTTPYTIEYLQQQNIKLEQQVADLSMKLSWFEEQFRLSQQKRFRSSSEQTDPDQLQLFNEAESNPSLEEPTVETITYRRKKQRGGREAMIEKSTCRDDRIPPTRRRTELFVLWGCLT